MVLAQPVGPLRQGGVHAGAHGLTRLHLDQMALAIVEADRLHPLEPLQRPGQTGRAVLSAREQDQSRCGEFFQDDAHDESAVGRSAARMHKGMGTHMGRGGLLHQTRGRRQITADDTRCHR